MSFPFYVQLVIDLLGCDPLTQFGVFAVALRNIAVPMDFAIVGKLAQTDFPGVSNAWIRKVVIDDVFPFMCKL
jgi:hypothetical protein